MTPHRSQKLESSITERLGVLSELSRLRLLRLLENEELSVGELSAIMQMAQSTVSRHLKVLLEGGWVSRRSEGTAARYWLSRELMTAETAGLWDLVCQQMGDTPQVRQDANRLQDVIASRQTDTKSYFGQLGGEWDTIRREMFGDIFSDEALLSLIPPSWTVADIGCGTGELSERLAPLVKLIHAVDNSKSMLSAARKRLKTARNVRFHCAELLDLPFEAGTLDACCVSLVLHHVIDPVTALHQLVQTVKPKTGRLLIVDMIEHDREEYHRRMGHQHLGFNPEIMTQWLQAAGLTDIRTRILTSSRGGKGPELFAIAGTRSA